MHLSPCEELEIARLEFGREITALHHGVNGLREQYREGNRNTLLAVAALALVSALLTAGLGYWGQLQSIKAGASQAHIGAAQAVLSSVPNDDLILAAENRGKTLEHQRWAQFEQDHPPPIQKRETIEAKRPK